MTKYTKIKQGFVIYYAVLVTSIVLTVSLLVADILTRQIIISSVGRNYEYAYYIAHAGRECAKYYDSQELFGTLLFDDDTGKRIIVAPADDLQLVDINCPGLTISKQEGESFYSSDNKEIKTVFAVRKDDACGKVEVRFNDRGFSVVSKGYNTCDKSNSRRIQAITESSDDVGYLLNE